MTNVRLLPVVVWLGNAPIHHGERDDSEACLCGHPYYFTCPEWLDGVDTVGSITVVSRGEHACTPEGDDAA